MYNSNNNRPFDNGKTTSTTYNTSKAFDKSNYGAKGATTNDFPKGINFYPPHEKAPDFVKGAITIQRDTMMEWLSQQKDTVRLDVKESKEGKLYLAINTYEKKA